MNFKPRDSKVICSSNRCDFDRFLICWLRDLKLFRKRFFSLTFLRSILLRLLTALLSVLFLSLLPLFLKGKIRQQDKIHFFYCLPVLSFVPAMYRPLILAFNTSASSFSFLS